MKRSQIGSALLALLVVLATVTVAIQPAAALGGSDDVFTDAVEEDRSWTGSWSASEDVVTYGAEDRPGWFVTYDEGHAGDLEAWANSSASRDVKSHNSDSNVMLIAAPADEIGVESGFWFGGEPLTEQSYVDQIDVNRRVSVDPITRTELKDKDSWSKPQGSFLATRAGTAGDFDADGSAWSTEVNKSSLSEAKAAIGADQVSQTGAGVRVAVLDTGLDYDTNLYGDRVPAGKNTITNTTLNITDPGNATASDYEAVADGSSSDHGSWISTAIAGNKSTPNGTGVAPGATLIPVKVLADDGEGTSQDVAEGLEYACGEANADVVSMSLGSPVPSDRINSEISECLTEDGVSTVVVAAGNNRLSYRYVASPGDSSTPGVVTVAASDSRAINESESAYFSAVGPDPETEVNPDVAAPGLKVTAEVADGNKTLSGTSMATPLTSGVAALTLEADSSLKGNPAELETDLESHAEPMAHAGTTEVGDGRISASNSVQDVTPEESQEEVQDDSAEARDNGNNALSGSIWHSRAASIAPIPLEVGA